MQCGCGGANRAQSDGEAYGDGAQNGKPAGRIVRAMAGTAYELWLRPADEARVHDAAEALRSHPDLAGGEARTPAGPVPYEVVIGAGLVLALPVAALDEVLPDIWYPIDGYEQNRAWREPLDVWLTQVADHVAHVVPIRHGLIGLGVSASPYDGEGVPDEREVSHLVPGRQGGAVRYPPTRWYTPW